MKMDGESRLVSGRIQRDRKRSYKDFMQDLDDTEQSVEEEDQECNTKTHTEPKKNRKHSGNGIPDPEECAVFLPASPNYVPLPQDGWSQREGKREVEEEKEIASQDKLLHAICTAEGSIEQVNQGSLPQYWEYPDDQDGVAGSHMKSPVGSIASPMNHQDYPILSLSNSVTPIADPLKYPDSALMSNIGSPASSLCCPTTTSASDSPTAGARAPGCIDLGPANLAAHLHLLGESMSLIGQHLQETNKLVWVAGGLSLLLDSLLCSLAPLTCLTIQIPELRNCSQHTMADTLDNIAYVMPGL